MGTEIERKFLVTGQGWRADAVGVPYRQGYLSAAKGRTVRVRVADQQAYLTIKGARQGLSRAEFEYEIPVADANYMLDVLCLQPLIEKTRWTLEYAGHIWEVDEFAGANAPLVVAEVELEREDQNVSLPEWVGEEVSTDYRYTNAYLAQNPYAFWPK